jgi:hypothetical protein
MKSWTPLRNSRVSDVSQSQLKRKEHTYLCVPTMAWFLAGHCMITSCPGVNLAMGYVAV